MKTSELYNRLYEAFRNFKTKKHGKDYSNDQWVQLSYLQVDRALGLPKMPSRKFPGPRRLHGLRRSQLIGKIDKYTRRHEKPFRFEILPKQGCQIWHTSTDIAQYEIRRANKYSLHRAKLNRKRLDDTLILPDIDPKHRQMIKAKRARELADVKSYNEMEKLLVMYEQPPSKQKALPKPK